MLPGITTDPIVLRPLHAAHPAACFFLALHGKSGNGLFDMAQTPSPPLRLHRSHEGEDAASLRRVAPSFLFIQVTLRNVAAPICSRISNALGAGGGRGGIAVRFPDRKKRLYAAFGGRKRLPTYIVGHSLRKREEPFFCLCCLCRLCRLLPPLPTAYSPDDASPPSGMFQLCIPAVFPCRSLPFHPPAPCRIIDKPCRFVYNKMNVPVYIHFFRRPTSQGACRP